MLRIVTMKMPFIFASLTLSAPAYADPPKVAVLDLKRRA